MPEFSLSFAVTNRRCRDGDDDKDLFWSAPAGFFERQLSEQIATLDTALQAKIALAGKKCKSAVEPRPILGNRLTDFYRDYGEGWWLERRGSDFVPTPEKGSEYHNAQTH